MVGIFEENRGFYSNPNVYRLAFFMLRTIKGIVDYIVKDPLPNLLKYRQRASFKVWSVKTAVFEVGYTIHRLLGLGRHTRIFVAYRSK